jgi:non-ribosomal peptide synthetase component E (peptide arylation enzyme)
LKGVALNAQAFLPGGWFLTGDVGCLDADGFLRITDRKKDIVNRGGEKIASREVENALLALPEVLDAAVLGMPDERLGERVCAYLVMKPGQTLTLDAVAAHFARLGLARQKAPERLLALDSLPRTASGKVNKPALREALKQPMPPRG